VDSVPVIWQNRLSVEEHASDLAELPVPVIWQNCLPEDSVPVIWQNCLSAEEHASGLEELHVPVIWQNCLAELSVCGEVGQRFGRIACMLRSKPVNWQKFLYAVKEHASDLVELPVQLI
jgi:hypothetical protein